MSSTIDWLDPVAFFWCSLGGVLLTGAWLLVGRFCTPSWAARISGVSTIGLLAASLALLALAPAAVLPCLAASAVAGILWATQSPRAAQLVRFLFTPATVSTAGFLGCLASAYLLGIQLQKVPDDDLPQRTVSDIEHEAVEGIQGATDQGRPIGFVRYSSTASSELERDYIDDPRYRQEIIRLARPNPDSNCHGWVFTDGQFGLQGHDVEHILVDNSYSVVERPQPGDLVVYRNLREQITHTGVVRSTVNNDLAIVESKWGPLGVYLHRPEMQPFGNRFAYYRSQRDGHRLQLDVDSSEELSAIGSSTAKSKWKRPGPMGIKSAKVRSRQS